MIFYISNNHNIFWSYTTFNKFYIFQIYFITTKKIINIIKKLGLELKELPNNSNLKRGLDE